MGATRLALIGLAAAALLLSIPAVRHLREQPPPPPPALALTFAPPPGAELGAGDEVLDAAVAPDGRAVAFVATEAGVTRLWRQALDAGRAEPVPGTEGARLPAWHPDGDRIAYFADGRLRVVLLADGTSRELAEAPEPAGAAWLPDGSILFAPRASGPLERLDDGVRTMATALAAGERAHAFPMAVGTTADVVYTAIGDDGRRTLRLAGAGGRTVELGPTAGHGQIAGGHLLWVQGDALLARALDDRLVPVGPSVALATGVGVTPGGRGLFAASPRLLLTAPAASRARVLAWHDLAGDRQGTAGEPGDFWQVRLAPDDRHAAVTMLAPLLRTLDVVVIPTGPTGDVEPLSLAVAADRHPVWSPAGSAILYQTLQGGAPELLVRATHQREAPAEPFAGGGPAATPTDWRDGLVLAHMPDPASGQDLWTIDVRTGARERVVQTGFNDTDGRWSPDGRWIAYVSDESGRPDVYARRLDGDRRVRVSTAGGARPRWSRDGRALYFLRGAWIVRADLDDDGGFATPVPVFEADGVRDFDVAHRRDALLALLPIEGGNAPPVSALVNWTSAVD